MNPRLEALQWSVRALAQPAQVQVTLFPAFVDPAFELITGFEECFEPGQSFERKHRLTEEQALRLRAIEQQLQAMSDANKNEVWDDDDCLLHPDWEELRKLARALLLAFSWPESPPPTHDAF